MLSLTFAWKRNDCCCSDVLCAVLHMLFPDSAACPPQPGARPLPSIFRRHCWAQRPADRPSFGEVVGRLRRLLADAPGS